jgi:hypothetical protein
MLRAGEEYMCFGAKGFVSCHEDFVSRCSDREELGGFDGSSCALFGCESRNVVTYLTVFWCFFSTMFQWKCIFIVSAPYAMFWLGQHATFVLNDEE